MTAEEALARIDDGTLARAELYGLLADAVDFPSRDFHMKIEAGVFGDEVAALASMLPYGVDVEGAAAGLGRRATTSRSRASTSGSSMSARCGRRARCTTGSGADRGSTRWRKCCGSTGTSG